MSSFDDILKLTITALFSDDVLFEQLVLKGGNAMTLVYHISPRVSLDLDFSMEADFDNVEEVQARMEYVLADRFNNQSSLISQAGGVSKRDNCLADTVIQKVYTEWVIAHFRHKRLEEIDLNTGPSVTAAAKALGVSRRMLHDILAGRKPISTVMCLKVSRLFGGSPDLWMRLQAAYDLKKAEQNKKVTERVARIVPVKPIKEVRA
jgi:addiction module HigA family antidote